MQQLKADLQRIKQNSLAKDVSDKFLGGRVSEEGQEGIAPNEGPSVKHVVQDTRGLILNATEGVLLDVLQQFTNIHNRET